MKTVKTILSIVAGFVLLVWGVKSCGDKMAEDECRDGDFSGNFELGRAHPDVVYGAKVYVMDGGKAIDSTLMASDRGYVDPERHPDYVYSFRKPLPVGKKWKIILKNGKVFEISDIHTGSFEQDEVFGKTGACILSRYRVNGKERKNDDFVPDFGQ